MVSPSIAKAQIQIERRGGRLIEEGTDLIVCSDVGDCEYVTETTTTFDDIPEVRKLYNNHRKQLLLRRKALVGSIIVVSVVFAAVAVFSTPVIADTAYDAGFAAGYSLGYGNGLQDGESLVNVSGIYEDGFIAGNESGYEDGLDDGYLLGYDDGYIEGWSTGNASGYSDGFADGYAEGYADGFDDGYSEGYDDGFEYGNETGYAQGFYDGELEGYADGFDDGYDEGYDDGYADGYAEGYEDGSEFPEEVSGYVSLLPAAWTALDDFTCSAGGNMQALNYYNDGLNVTGAITGPSGGYITFAWPLTYLTDNGLDGVANVSFNCSYSSTSAHTVSMKVRTPGTTTYTQFYNATKSPGLQTVSAVLVGTGGLYADMDAAGDKVCNITGQIEVQFLFVKTGPSWSMDVTLDQIRMQAYVVNVTTQYRQFYGVPTYEIQIIIPISIATIVIVATRRRYDP